MESRLYAEITSRKTRKVDLGPKFALYERQGVQEYLLFDPLGEYLRPLPGYRLEGGLCADSDRAVILHALVVDDPDTAHPRVLALCLYSEVLELVVCAKGDQLRFYDPQQQAFLPTRPEARAITEAHTREAEVQAAAAEAELAALREQLRRLPGPEGPS